MANLTISGDFNFNMTIGTYMATEIIRMVLDHKYGPSQKSISIPIMPFNQTEEEEDTDSRDSGEPP